MKELSPKIIRAWFDTILNPFIEGIENEIITLNNNNLTWSGFKNRFEILKPLHQMFHYRYHANFEQLAAYNPEILEIIDKHDRELDNLNKACYGLYHKLVNSQIIKDTYHEIVKDYLQKDNEIDEILQKKLIETDNCMFISEYIINNKADLNKSYILSSIWNPNKEKFKSILTLEEFTDFVKNKELAFTNFSIVVSGSLKDLKSIRNVLSIKSGEPIVIAIENEKL